MLKLWAKNEEDEPKNEAPTTQSSSPMCT